MSENKSKCPSLTFGEESKAVHLRLREAIWIKGWVSNTMQ